jgi:transposase
MGRKKSHVDTWEGRKVIHPNAAGLEIGSEEIWAAAPPERTAEPPRKFGTFTVKNVPGRKSDIQDCQWLQGLHSVGLLRGSFRPEGEIVALRAYLRHRATLIEYRAAHIQHMQKAL